MSIFELIGEAIDEVRYPEFFRCEPLTAEERKRVEAIPNLPQSYLKFLETFGRARFFRELYRDRHKLFVYPPPPKLPFYKDSYMVGFGAVAFSMPLMFKWSELESGVEPPVYDLSCGSPRRRADSFTEWLTKVWERTRKAYTKKDWARVQAGPEPFTESEHRIVQIRRGFSWRQLEPRNGNIAVEITNGSDGKLPFYSIGVKGKYADFRGGFHLKVSTIEPGAKEVVEISLSGGYDQSLTAETAVLCDKGEPVPERREDFWEFRGATGSRVTDRRTSRT